MLCWVCLQNSGVYRPACIADAVRKGYFTPSVHYSTKCQLKVNPRRMCSAGGFSDGLARCWGSVSCIWRIACYNRHCIQNIPEQYSKDVNPFMALYTCPDCGKEISDRADRCIHCGCSVGSRMEDQNRSKLFLAVLVVLVAFVVGIVMGVLARKAGGADIELPFGIKPEMAAEEMNQRMLDAGFLLDYTQTENRRTEYIYQPSSVNGAESPMTLLSLRDGRVEVAHFYQEDAAYGVGNVSPQFISFREGLVQKYGLPTHEDKGECTWESGAYALRLYYIGTEGGHLWLDTLYDPDYK